MLIRLQIQLSTGETVCSSASPLLPIGPKGFQCLSVRHPQISQLNDSHQIASILFDAMSCFYLFLLQNSAGWMHRQQIFPRSACPINIARFKKPKRKNVYLALSIFQFIQILRASLYLQCYNLWQRGLLKAEHVDTFVNTSFCIMGQLTKHCLSG